MTCQDIYIRRHGHHAATMVLFICVVGEIHREVSMIKHRGVVWVANLVNQRVEEIQVCMQV